ncbi:uncharacterized protein N7459_003866 [Penicillium hispanicum]|uniref:uncharacterized protein n=1 Tax=Penicillium hispanicum TaxID=1080232 RepID=UPI00253FDFEF|nr:uncharacterized protein N7459_003866 [Penicillium hispanicum]KAJ5584066.1 hypothetical protein N7459_003866 [Penicillium hispanicum]
MGGGGGEGEILQAGDQDRPVIGDRAPTVGSIGGANGFPRFQGLGGELGVVDEGWGLVSDHDVAAVHRMPEPTSYDWVLTGCFAQNYDVSGCEQNRPRLVEREGVDGDGYNEDDEDKRSLSSPATPGPVAPSES